MSFCIYSGTFNPIHNAHINVALGVLKNFDTDKIIFIPSFLPPHKNDDIVSSEHRINMLKEAVEEYEKFEISDIEIMLKGKSYSYNTVMKIKKKYNISERINFIIGTDAFEKLDSWYKAQDFVNLVNFIVVPRCRNFDIEKSRKKIELQNVSYTSLELPFLDISSTQIRNNVKKNISISKLVPSKVEKYILKHNLYS